MGLLRFVFIGAAAILCGAISMAGCADRAAVTTGQEHKAPSAAVDKAPPSETPVAAPPSEERVIDAPQPLAATTVENPPPTVIPVEVAGMATLGSGLAAGNLIDVFFDFDRFSLTKTAKEALTGNAAQLKTQEGVKILIEGHCDERGTRDYNLLLGEQRAQAVKRYLEDLGIPAPRIETVSYGKEKPSCTGRKHACWRQNRRAHVIVQPSAP